jgi:DNA-directed RNA polymerase specialized sigma24 family protein
MTPLAPAHGLVMAPPDPESRAEQMLLEHGVSLVAVLGSEGIAPSLRRPALATCLMDLFRRTGAAEVFECLIRLTSSQLQARVRSRLRHIAPFLDPQEVFQDTIVNVYRYPDRFDPCRPGAFAAWSSTIVDNTIRRLLRKNRSGPDIALSPGEVLAQHPDLDVRTPDLMVQHVEDCTLALCGFRLFLLFYFAAYQNLSERERFVLQMVDVQRVRYAELAGILDVRPEALKMVVFRARKRIHDRLAHWLGRGSDAAAA